MAKFFELFLFAMLLVLATANVGDNEAVDDSSSSKDVDDQEGQGQEIDVEVGELPSMLGMLGSKLSVADNIYDEYTADADAEDSDDDDDLQQTEPTAPCCFPSVWQGRLKSDFGFVPIGGRGRRGKVDEDDEDDVDKKGKKHKGHKKKGGSRRGRPISARAIDQVYVDGANRRLAGDKTVFGDRPGKPMNFSYIVLVGQNRTADLYLFNRTAQKCRHRRLTNVAWRQQCLPPNATLRGQFSLGPDVGGLSVQSWTIDAGPKRVGASIVGADGDDNVDETSEEEVDEVEAQPTTRRPRPRPKPRPRVFVKANVLVVPRSCTPVVIQEEGIVMVGGRGDEFDLADAYADEFNKDGKKPKPRPKPRPSKARGEAFIGSVYFTDVKNSISDPSVFRPPSFCKATPNALYFDEMEDEMPSVLERFLVL